MLALINKLMDYKGTSFKVISDVIAPCLTTPQFFNKR
jgi:hypothetical protein